MPSATDNDVIQGALKLIGKVDCNCWTSIADFLQAFPSLFAVELPSNLTNVSVSNTQPDDDQLDNLWIRLDNAGSVIGLFIYSMGDWRQIWPVPNMLIRMYGNSGNVPTGYMLADSSNPNFTAAQATAIMATWILVDPADPTLGYAVFDVTFTGY